MIKKITNSCKVWGPGNLLHEVYFHAIISSPSMGCKTSRQKNRGLVKMNEIHVSLIDDPAFLRYRSILKQL